MAVTADDVWKDGYEHRGRTFTITYGGKVIDEESGEVADKKWTRRVKSSSGWNKELLESEKGDEKGGSKGISWNWSKPIPPQVTPNQKKRLPELAKQFNTTEEYVIADLIMLHSPQMEGYGPAISGTTEGVALSWEALLNLPTTVWNWATGKELYDEIDLTPEWVTENIGRFVGKANEVLKWNGYSEAFIGPFVEHYLNRSIKMGITLDIVFDPVSAVFKITSGGTKITINLLGKVVKAAQKIAIKLPNKFRLLKRLGAPKFKVVKIDYDWRVVARSRTTGRFVKAPGVKLGNKAFRFVRRADELRYAAKAHITASAWTLQRRILKRSAIGRRILSSKYWTKVKRRRAYLGYGRVVIKPKTFILINRAYTGKIRAAAAKIPASVWRMVKRVRGTAVSLRTIKSAWRFAKRVVRSIRSLRRLRPSWTLVKRAVRITRLPKRLGKVFKRITRAAKGIRSLRKLSVRFRLLKRAIKRSRVFKTITAPWRFAKRVKAGVQALKKLHPKTFKLLKRISQVAEAITYIKAPWLLIPRIALGLAKRLVKLKIARWKRVKRIRQAGKGKLLARVRLKYSKNFKMLRRRKTAGRRAVIKLAGHLFVRVVKAAQITAPVQRIPELPPTRPPFQPTTGPSTTATPIYGVPGGRGLAAGYKPSGPEVLQGRDSLIKVGRARRNPLGRGLLG